MSKPTSAIEAVADFLEESANLSVISQFTAIQEWIDTANTGSAPVATLHDDGYYTFHGEKPHGFKYQGWRMDVYAAAGSLAASVLTDEQKDAIGRIEYFLKAWEFNGVGKTIKTVQDSPDSCAAIDIADLRALLAASARGD